MFAANILIAVVWSMLTGSMTLGNLALGFVIGCAGLGLAGGATRSRYIRRVWGGAWLGAFAVYELILANVRVAWYTVSSLKSLEPAILAVPLEQGLTDGELSLLAMLVTLTPGTLSLDVAEDRRSLYVHFMHIEDADDAIRSITEGFQRLILGLRG